MKKFLYSGAWSMAMQAMWLQRVWHSLHAGNSRSRWLCSRAAPTKSGTSRKGSSSGMPVKGLGSGSAGSHSQTVNSFLTSSLPAPELSAARPEHGWSTARGGVVGRWLRPAGPEPWTPLDSHRPHVHPDCHAPRSQPFQGSWAESPWPVLQAPQASQLCDREEVELPPSDSHAEPVLEVSVGGMASLT